ncbi:MAG: hypothetical protein K9L61_00615 [Candidatus Omnitrophica bacterium]|nr:hypothetical protein [Candidatus Omnitrophota bacterium]
MKENKKKLKKFVAHKAQAILEMAIFASLLFIVFGSLLSYLQNMQDKQYVLQESFRRALAKSRSNNAAVTYTIIEARRRPNINSPLAGERSSTSASAVVNWAVPDILEDGSVDNVSQTWYKVNKDEISARSETTNSEDQTEDDDDSEDVDDTTTDVQGYVRNINNIATGANSTNAYQSAELKESIRYQVVQNNGEKLIDITQHLGPDGEYSQSYSEGTTYRKERRWVTEHE